ncbi:hypothetical protein [Akkermansia muciniphila]|jgi:predicted transcriptional regulator|uniref:hypothetical protein n=1 Tax=Akkermansia muciniphila TaxID=239935 RepID=UPI00201DA618|nr:hypothetical protein [Akkermansia muciniphila]MCL6680239.1 hypothetical protein [Akkermansia muciniphila]
MINILLSVSRPFSGFIMDGQKTWELRKNKPRIPHGEHVTLWLYESGKDGEWAIIGKCRIVSYVALRHMPFGDALDLLIREACVTEEHIREQIKALEKEAKSLGEKLREGEIIMFPEYPLPED